MNMVDLDVQLGDFRPHLPTTNSRMHRSVFLPTIAVNIRKPDFGTQAIWYWQCPMECDSLRNRLTVYAFLQVAGTT